MSENAESLDRVSSLFDEHAARLFAHARRSVGHDDAQDLVAGAFEVAVRRAGDLPQDSGEAFAWLVGIVRKLVANDRRRAKVAHRHWVEQVRALWHLPTHLSLADAVADREAALTALAELSPRDREVLLLVAWDGLSADQAARVTGCSPSTFAVRLHRARSRLEQARSLTGSTRIATGGTR